MDLLNSTTRSLSLIHEGRLLFNYCKTLQNEIDNIRDLAESFHKEPSGILKISTIDLIQQYSNKFTKVRIEVNIEEKMPDFIIQETDIILGVNWTPPEDIIARKIAYDSYVLAQFI